MKINEIQVDGFGVWKGLVVEELDSNVTVFYGQNEAGKTTLMQFVRSVMFGFSPERREKYVPPVYGGLAGGNLMVSSGNGVFEVQRHVDPNRHADPGGDLTVIDNATGDVHGAIQLATIMGNVDESIYNNVFAVGLREIQELNALNNTQAADHLYRLTSGLDRVSLVDVMRDTTRRRNAIWSDANDKGENSSRLASLQRRRHGLQREIEELRAKSRKWARIAAQARDAQLRLEETARRIGTLEKECRQVELAMQISERWNRRRMLTSQIEGFGILPDPREISVARLDELNEKIARHREKISALVKEKKKVHRDADKLGVNRTVWGQRHRIEALVSHSPWIESLQKNAGAIHAEIESLTGSINGEVAGLGSHLKLKGELVEQLASRNFASLKTLAKEMSDQQTLVNQLKDESEKFRFELAQHEKSLGDGLSETTGSIPESLEDTSRHVNRLRRRIELEEKINKLQRSQSELEREVDDVVEDQVLPPGKLAVIGVVFIIGTVLAIVGAAYDYLFDDPGRTNETLNSTGFMMMMFGIICGLVAWASKYHWERIARENLDDFRHQMEMVRTQLKRAKNERDEIDRLLPHVTGQHQLELKDAEMRLGNLQDLVPMENRVKSARMRLEDIRRQISAQERELERIEKQWQSSLRTLGLPENLAPPQVREISQRSSRIATHQARADVLKSELALREKELSDVAIRVEELARETGLQMTVSRRKPLEALTILTGALSDQRQLIVKRKEMRTLYNKMRGQQSRLTRELDELRGQRTKLLSSVGVLTEEEYRQFDLQHAQRNGLIQDRNQISEQIAAAIGKNFTESQMKPLLDNNSLAALEKKWESLGSDIDELRKEHSSLLQHRGELLQEIKGLGEDNKLDLALLDLNAVDQEIQDLQSEWQVLAATSQMLEAIREGYEAKRQPETLREASGYLSKLTDGTYKRIWTKMIGEQLLVDNSDNETITVDQLSRGTREAVYLSLRLALVGVYARRGAVLPIILDDILVNFDAKRARHAARVLVDFANNGYQILMFTCHDHMRDMFHELNADVRVLPHHRDVVENDAKPWSWNRDRIFPSPAVAATKTEAAKVTTPAEPVRVSASAGKSLAALRTSEFDAELEFELSEIARDQKTGEPIRFQMKYHDSESGEYLDLPENEEIWSIRPNGRQTA